jgi:quercetin dioxygenase-like cupin family protein
MMRRSTWIALAFGAAGGFGASAGAQNAKQLAATPASQVRFRPLDPQNAGGKGPQMAVVFGDERKGPLGFLLKTQPGERPGPHTHSSDFYGVVIQGIVHNFAAGGPEGQGLGPGSIYFTPAGVPHDNHCEESSSCLFFVYAPNGFDFIPVGPSGR